MANADDKNKQQGTAASGSGSQESTHEDAAPDTALDPQDARHANIFRTGSQLLSDPFSDATRERQKLLLGLALLTLGVSRSLFVLKCVTLADTEVEFTSQNLSYVLAAITAYVTILFGVGAWQEFTRAKYEMKWKGFTLRRLFIEAVTAPARLGAALAQTIEDGAPFTKAWEEATEHNRQTLEALELEREEIQKLLDAASAAHKLKLQGLKAEQRLTELERYRKEKDVLDDKEDDIEVLIADSNAKLQRRRNYLRKKHYADEYSEKLTEIVKQSARLQNDTSAAASAEEIYETTVRHLRWRRWVEMWLPIALGVVAIASGLLPVKPPLH